jgi:hypothetical protein
VIVITPGAGCSITSTATVSTTGVTGGFTFRAAFFTGAGLGLALATVRFGAFVALDTPRALPRLAELRSFAGFCTFDAFLRLAMIAPLVLRNDTTVQVSARYQTRVITRFHGFAVLMSASRAVNFDLDQRARVAILRWNYEPASFANKARQFSAWRE